MRERCQRCRRPASACYCAALPTLDTSTRVVILQHPRERDMPIGTARMASLCLPRASLHVGVRWDSHLGLRDALGDPSRPAILLYPGPGAKDILREPPRGPVTLIVVDGTWSQAKTVVRDNPILHALPRYAFAAPEPSEYRIRREPRDDYVSTIEALMYVLGALEGDAPRFRALLAPLRAMVDVQLAARARGWSPRSKVRFRGGHPARTARSKLPAALFDRWDDVVCVVGEASAWPFAEAARRADESTTSRDELVHWVAHRPASGQTFEIIVATEGPLSPTASFHTRLDEARLRGGVSRAELFSRFAAWSRPDDIVCAWGHYGVRLFAASGGALAGGASRIDLRDAARRFTQAKVGMLEDYAAKLGVGTAPVLAEGRAGARLSMIVGIVEAWRATPLTARSPDPGTAATPAAPELDRPAPA